MSQTSAWLQRAGLASRRIAGRAFAIPIAGYVLRIPISIVKLPRLCMHVRRIDAEVQRLARDHAERSGIGEQIAATNTRMAALEQLDVHNALKTIPALCHESTRLRRLVEQIAVKSNDAESVVNALAERIEAVRHEVLREIMGDDDGPPSSSNSARVIARVVNEEKLLAAQRDGRLRLHLGCGNRILPDYVNVDTQDLAGVDIIADVAQLPFKSGSVDEIFSINLVDRFPQQVLQLRLLPYWRRLLRPGGKFRAITCDGAAMLSGTAAGACDFDAFRETLFGGPHDLGTRRLNLFTPATLRNLLEGAGFVDISVPVSERNDGRHFEFEIAGSIPH